MWTYVNCEKLPYGETLVVHVGPIQMRDARQLLVAYDISRQWASTVTVFVDAREFLNINTIKNV